MSYESAIIEALGLTAPPGDAPAAVQSAWSALQTAIANWRQMHGVSNQSSGEGPSVGMFKDGLAQAVSIHLGAYKNALATAGLVADPMLLRRPIGTGWDFSTRHVPV